LEEFRVINQHCNTDMHYESSPLNIDKNHENYRVENTNLQSLIYLVTLISCMRFMVVSL
jgi:hypothetical protein